MYVATIAVLTLAWLYFWQRYNEPFHPLVVLLPQLAFLYGYMPLELVGSDPDRFELYAGGGLAQRYQAIAMVLVAGLCAGVVTATAGITRSGARWHRLPLRNEAMIRWSAAALGLAGLAAWLFMVTSSGGFAGAYGTAYGGGWAASGYVREARYIGLVGALLVYMTRVGRGMRPADWALVVLCVAPTLVHAILGARRGPAFLALVVLAGGYVYFMRKRLPMAAILAGGLSVGVLMMFLVANRSVLHLGGDLTGLRDPLAHLLRWQSNEYLIGGAVVRYADTYGPFYGAREATWLVARLLPDVVWPTVYADLPRIFGVTVDLTVNGGVSREGIATLASWTPSVGSAEGFVGSLWLEFGWLAPGAAFLIGLFYGNLWARARTSTAARVVYLIAVALSVYLVMQALDPWLYRLALFGMPAFLVLRVVGGGRPGRASAGRAPRRRAISAVAGQSERS